MTDKENMKRLEDSSTERALWRLSLIVREIAENVPANTKVKKLLAKASARGTGRA